MPSTVRLMFGLVAVASALFGFVGLRSHVGIEAGVADLIYWDLQLFVLDSQPVSGGGDLPLALQLARFGAPLATGYAVFSAATVLFRSQVDAARARWSRDHTVVCGVDPASVFVSRRLAEQGERVVVIDPFGSQALPGLLRAKIALVVTGDPRQESSLRRAGAHRAKNVMALGEAGTFNAEVAKTFVELCGEDAGPTSRCYVEVEDRELCAELAASTLSSSQGLRVRVEFFSRHDRAARKLLQRWPIAIGEGDRAVVVVGAGPLGWALVNQLNRRWRGQLGLGRKRLPVRIIGDSRVDSGRLDAAVDALQVEVVLLGDEALTVDDLRLTGDDGQRLFASHVFVCLPDDSLAIRSGLAVTQLATSTDPLVVVCVAGSNVFGQMLEGTLAPRGGSPVWHHITQSVFSPTAIRQGELEEIACAAHEVYVSACHARGETVPSNPSMVTWDRLSEDLRETNRDQAADIGRKLAAIGCAAVPAPTAPDPFAFKPGEVEKLADMEHQRWSDHKKRQRWRYGPERNDAQRCHPDLVPWNDLPDDKRSRSFEAVKAIPSLLQIAGLAIVRGDRPTADADTHR